MPSKKSSSRAREHARQSFPDLIKYCILKVVLLVIYLVSHVYDYLFYPIYWAAHHPWVVRKYNRANHARREDAKDYVIFHSLCEPGEKNIELERNECVYSATIICSAFFCQWYCISMQYCIPCMYMYSLQWSSLVGPTDKTSFNFKVHFHWTKRCPYKRALPLL